MQSTTSEDLARATKKVSALQKAKAACDTVYACIDDIGPIENLNQADSKELVDLLRWALQLVVKAGQDPYDNSIKALQDFIFMANKNIPQPTATIDDADMDF